MNPVYIDVYFKFTKFTPELSACLVWGGLESIYINIAIVYNI